MGRNARLNREHSDAQAASESAGLYADHDAKNHARGHRPSAPCRSLTLRGGMSVANIPLTRRNPLAASIAW